MKTQASEQIQPYEVSGQELRIHWNIVEKTREDLEGTTTTYWEADEALCDIHDTRPQLIEKIMATQYSTGREFATINNQAIDVKAYEDYQAFRVQAKALADGWLNKD